MTSKPTPFFDEPQDKPTKYDGLFGWSADWKCGNDSNLLIVFYVQIMPDDFVMQLHRF
ncbi:putative carnitine operon oxidoreductase [Escherichia coli]|nr:putative carnitine operon oxidoreductase [Escherichia coli]